MRTYAHALGQGVGDGSLQQGDMDPKRDNNRVRHREMRVREEGGRDGNEGGVVKAQMQQRRHAQGTDEVAAQGQ